MRRIVVLFTALAGLSTAHAAPCVYQGSVPIFVRCIAAQASEALDVALGNQAQLEATQYWQTNGLNTTSVTATSSWVKIDDYLTFTKAHDDTVIEAVLESRVGAGTFSGATSVLLEIRLDGALPTWGGVRALTTSGAIEQISMTNVFTDAVAGTHTVSVWARTSGGTSSAVVLDPGGYAGRILVKETR
jgi:hypothetical protein